jgi:hypothetical protein
MRNSGGEPASNCIAPAYDAQEQGQETSLREGASFSMEATADSSTRLNPMLSSEFIYKFVRLELEACVLTPVITSKPYRGV